MPPVEGAGQGISWRGLPSRGRSSIAARGEVRDDRNGQGLVEGDADAAGEFVQERLGLRGPCRADSVQRSGILRTLRM